MEERPTDTAHATNAGHPTGTTCAADRAGTTDAELVRDARQGDTAAFEALTARHFPMVYALAYARLGAREAAEDLAQEVFLLATLHLGALADPARFAAWLGRIARNEAGMWRRRSQSASRLVRLVPLDDLPAEPAAPASQDARTVLEADEETRALHEALFRLPEALREVVLLHYFEDLTKAEIAERLEVHPATVGRQIEKALKAMKRTLEPILRRAAPAFRHSGKAAARTTLLVGAVAAMSGPAKAALLAEAGASVAMLAAATQTAVSWHTILTGGFLMSAKTQFTAVLILLALVAGGTYYQVSRTPAAPKEPVAAASGVRPAAPAAPASTGAVLPSDSPPFKEVNEANKKQIRTARITLLHRREDYPDPDKERLDAELKRVTEKSAADLEAKLSAKGITPETAEGYKTLAASILATVTESLTKARESETQQAFSLDFESGKFRVDTDPAGGRTEPADLPSAGVSFMMRSIAIYQSDGLGGTYWPLTRRIEARPVQGTGVPANVQFLYSGVVDSTNLERWAETGRRAASVDGHPVTTYELASTRPEDKRRLVVYADPELGYRYRRTEVRSGDELSELRLAREYRTVNGVPVPFYWEYVYYWEGSGGKSVKIREVTRVQEAEVNVALPADAFLCQVVLGTMTDATSLTPMFTLPGGRAPNSLQNARVVSREETIERTRPAVGASAGPSSATQPAKVSVPSQLAR